MQGTLLRRESKPRLGVLLCTDAETRNASVKDDLGRHARAAPAKSVAGDICRAAKSMAKGRE